jgi:hypothetical protein
MPPLNEEERALVATVREFMDRAVRPVANARDHGSPRPAPPRDVMPTGSSRLRRRVATGMGIRPPCR